MLVDVDVPVEEDVLVKDVLVEDNVAMEKDEAEGETFVEDSGICEVKAVDRLGKEVKADEVVLAKEDIAKELADGSEG